MNIKTGESICLDRLILPNNVKPLYMKWIKAGTFLMGSPLYEPERNPDERQFSATISSGFWLGQFLVTQAHWCAAGLPNPSQFSGLDLPVENVTWYDAMKFCMKLNEVYAGTMPAGYSFSLPTEVQWEFACRAGTTTKFSSGDSLSDLDRVAWHKENSGGHTHPVGTKEPNAWDLYDMHGNVAEWCFDEYCEYPKADYADWTGKSTDLARLSIDLGVDRSAGWGSPPGRMFRSACRGYGSRQDKRAWFGFRLSLRADQDSQHELSTRGSTGTSRSPRVKSISWGRMDIEGLGQGRDFKLFPGGGRQWDWKETNTHHVPGIQFSDVAELLQHGSEVVVLSRGMELALQVCPETMSELKSRGVNVFVEETNAAVAVYNSLVDKGASVGGLFHSTC